MKKFARVKYIRRTETKGIMLFNTPEEMSGDDYGNQQLRKGWLSIGYNYLLHTDGTLEEGMGYGYVSDPDLRGWNDHVTILVMGLKKTDPLNDAQVKTLMTFATKHKLTIANCDYHMTIKEQE